MLALIYARVSTEEQAKKGYSLPEQLEACRKRASELGALETVEIVDDVGGDYLERPKLEQARQLVRAGGIKWFLCLDPDRFSRNLLNQLLVTDEIDKAGTELIFIQHRREKTAEGNLFYAIRGAISEFEKKKILERTQRGKRGKAKQGLLPGNLDPYGYTMDTEQDRLVINDLEAPWVRKMYEWAADPDPGKRMGQYRIAEMLNSMGVPAPRGNHWYRSTVAGILHNPLYTGLLRWGRYDHSGVYQSKRAGGPRVKARPRSEDQVINLTVPAIVESDTFERVQQFIQLDKHRRSRGRTFMLTGIGMCGLCGGHIQTKPIKVRYLVCANRYPLYKDMSEDRRAATQPCKLPHIPADKVEAFVWKTVCEWITDPKMLQKALETDDRPPGNEQSLQNELDVITRQITELEQAQSRVIALVARARVKPEIAEGQLNELTSQVQALTQKRVQLEGQVSLLSRSTASTAQIIGVLEAVANEVKGRLDAISDENRISLVRRLVSRVVVRGKREEDWEVIPIRFA